MYGARCAFGGLIPVPTLEEWGPGVLADRLRPDTHTLLMEADIDRNVFMMLPRTRIPDRRSGDGDRRQGRGRDRAD